jgi:hypothetical protein
VYARSPRLSAFSRCDRDRPGLGFAAFTDRCGDSVVAEVRVHADEACWTTASDSASARMDAAWSESLILAMSSADRLRAPSARW